MSTFERNTANDDAAIVAAQFADTFLAAGPGGAIMVPAVAFAQKLPDRKRIFDAAGLQSSKLVSSRDTRLGDRYVLVDTKWQMDFVPDGKPATCLTVGSSFLIDMGGPEPKILAYVTHQDIFEKMKERGLLSSS
jgi:hypothetical protein